MADYQEAALQSLRSGSSLLQLPEECYLAGFPNSNGSRLTKQGGEASASLSASLLTSQRLTHKLTSGFSGDACLRLSLTVFLLLYLKQ